MTGSSFPRALALCLCLAVLPPAARSEGLSEAEQAHIEANLLSIFFHEVGHALVDIMELPVFGQEEDAADTASILLVDALFEEAAAQEIARYAAFGFLDEAAAAEAEPAWWDVHGPDEQRYYNLVCLFFGADPDKRAILADDLGLPEERADSCEEEFDLANSSWGPVFDELVAAGPGQTLRYIGGSQSLTEELISQEVSFLNSMLSLPQPLKVSVRACQEANAFYDPSLTEITICEELESHLQEILPED